MDNERILNFMSEFTYLKSVEKWGIFEAEMPGKSDGNPFIDYAITGTFKSKNETKINAHNGRGRPVVARSSKRKFFVK